MRGNRRTLLPIAVLLALVVTIMAVPSQAAKRAWRPDPVKYGDVVVQNVHIRMSDGVELVGDVEYPADLATGNAVNGRFPVLLTQNPYVCSVPASGSNAYYVGRGYIFATVCVRGAGRSGGRFGFMSRRDQLDGVELVNWAAHQLPGSNGVVGLPGCSSPALPQIFTAGALPKNSPVKEIAPSCAGTDMFRESASSGGVPTESLEYMFPGIAGLIGARAGVFGAKTVATGLAGGDPAYDGAAPSTAR